MSYVLLVRSGDKYPKEYADILRKQIPQKVVVLGDDLSLKHDYPSWWCKMNIFHPDIPKPFLYIDLDSFVMGDLSPVFKESTRLICREWMPGLENRAQSSVMWVTHGDDIWAEWSRCPDHWMRSYVGDQDFLGTFQWGYFQDVLPGFVGSYKLHNKEKPVNTVVTFHGYPKMKDAKGWANERWTQLSS